MRAEILFPHSTVSALIGFRSTKWRDLIRRVARLPEDDPEALAFSLMMIRLNGCLDCNPDRFKALMGCAACAKRTIGGYKGSDDALLLAYKKSRAEVEKFSVGEQMLEQAA
ncbi:MAG: hypothetical protein HY327_00440 [Chloroflexi bacterium]|nr:hypothetical protein [Chloroflexota bacterium]